MDKVKFSDFVSSDNKIADYNLSGFDLIVKMENGEQVIVENGLTEMFLQGATLSTTSGQQVTIEDVVQKISSTGNGLDSVYLEDMFSFELKEADAENESEETEAALASRYSQLLKMIKAAESELAKKNAAKEEQNNETQDEIDAQKKELEEKAKLIEKKLEEIEAAKEQKKNKTSAEKLREQQSQSDDLNIPPPVAVSENKNTSTDKGKSDDDAPELEVPVLPEVPEIPDATELFVTGSLSEDSDTGKKGDGITANNTPTFAGKTLPNTGITLTINGIAYSIMSDKNGNWSFKLPTKLPNDIYEYEITVTDDDGNRETTAGTVTIDNAIPTLSEIAWLNNDVDTTNVVNDKRPSLVGKSAPGATITLQIEGKTYKTVADDDGKWAIIVTTPLQDGLFNYTLTAETKAGLTDTTSASVTVDTSVDTSYFWLDEASDSGSQGDFITNNATPTFKGKTEANAQIVLNINGTDYTFIADADGNWSFDVPALADGTYEIKIQITDSAGNSASIDGSITIDVVLPETTLAISNENGDIYEGDTINTSAPTFSGKTEPFATVTLSFFGADYQVKADKDGNWSYTFEAPLEEGELDFSITVVDVAGNVSSTQAGQLLVDFTPPSNPTVSLSENSNTGTEGDNTTNLSRPELTGTGEAGCQIIITFSNGIIYTATASADGTWSVPVGPFTDGVYSYTAQAVDNAGNKSELVENNTVVIDTSKPTVIGGLATSSDLGSSNSDGITSQTNPTFSGTATPNSTIILNINGAKHPIQVNSDGEWSHTLTDTLPDDNYTYTLTVTNTAGTSATISGNITIDSAIDKSSSGLASSSDTGAFDDDGITKDRRPTLTGKTEPNAQAFLTLGGVDYELEVDANGNWSFAYPSGLADLDANLHTYTVTVTDLAGNSETFEHSFTVDLLAEISAGLSLASIAPESPPTVTNDIRPTFSGTSEPGSTVTFIYADVSYSVLVDDEGNWKFRLPVAAILGNNDYSVTVVDLAGNTNQQDGTFTFVPSGVTPPSGYVELVSDFDSGIKGDMITNIQRPQFTGIVTPGTTATLTINGVTYTLSPDVNGRFTFSLPEGVELREGVNTVVLTVTDEDTDLSMTQTERVIFDTQLPPAETGLQLDTNTGATDDFRTRTNENNVISGKTEPGAKVTFTMGGATYPVTIDENGAWSVTIPQRLAEGNHPFTVTVTDAAGNTSTHTETLIIDRTAKTFFIEFDSSKFDFSGWAFSSTRPGMTIKGDVLDDPNSIVTITYGGVTITGKVGEYIQFPPGLNFNQYYSGTLTVTVTDSAGNVSTQNHHNVRMCENKNLTITGGIVESSDTDTIGDNATGISKPDLTGVINAPQGPTYTVTITIAGATYNATTNFVDGKLHWTFNYPDSAPGLTPGEHPYTITVTDNFKGSSSTTHTVTIVSLNMWLSEDTNTGELDDFYTQNNSPVIKGKATPGAVIRVQFDDIYYDVVPDSEGNWTFPLPGAPLAEGAYTIRVTESLNGTTTTIENTISIDSTPPTTTFEFDDSVVNGTNPNITNWARPIFKGITEPLSTVTVVINGETYEVIADTNGNWSFQTNNLPDNEYNYTVSVIDPAGNVSTETMEGSFIVDNRIATTVSTAHGPDVADGAQYNTPDGVFYGTADPYATIRIWVAGSKVETQADEHGNWKLDAGSLFWNQNVGERYSTVKVQALSPDSGAFYESTYRVVFVSKALPTTTVNLQQSGIDDNATNQSKPTLTGSTSGRSIITIVINGETYTTTANSNGIWSFTLPTPLEDDTYDYTVTVTDIYDRDSLPVSGSLIVDTSNPTLDCALDLANDTGIVGDGITHNTSQTLSGRIEPGNLLTITINGISYNPTIDELGNWQLNLTDLNQGKYDYVVTTTNSSGNTTSANGTFVIDTVIDAPTVTLDRASDSGVIGDNTTNITTPSFSGQGEPGSTVTFVINSVTYTTVVDSNGKWRLTIPDALPQGNHPYTVTVTDVAGNVSDPVIGSLNIVVTPQTDHPDAGITASLIGGVNGTLETNTKKPVIGGTAAPNATIIVTIAGVAYKTTANANGDWSVTISSPLSDSQHSFTAQSVDYAGNLIAETDGTFEVDTVTTVTVNGVLGLDDTIRTQFTNDSTPTFKGTGEPGSTISLTIDGQEFTGVVDSAGNWSITVGSHLPDDNYNYQITITDTAGNTNSASGSITVDTAMPTDLTCGLSTDSAVNGHSNVSQVNKPDFSGTTEPGAKITLTINGYVFTTFADNTGAWTIDYSATNRPPLLDKDYEYSVVVTDKAGNTLDIPVTGTITVAANPPSSESSLAASSDSGDKGDKITNDTTPTIVGNTKPGSTIVITIGATTYPVVVSADGSWIFNVEQPLTEGDFTYMVTATDLYGNSNSTTNVIDIDLTGAASTITINDAPFIEDVPFSSNNSTPTFSGETEAGAKVVVNINGINYPATLDAQGIWSVTIP
ncbi:hypothetical protein DDN69_17395, partial [Vibrio cholerae]|nr:hypothetical protein [Vibrio cholerae]